ncbi:DUF364 domain-containing protein [Desulfolutivibrio sulfoxidireducens]|uniref:DUF364 domain-containing protein n=1 Tax=Desulfolutivibrio sulfoxidireducens TaxID=2773299 RepID=UPI00159E1866|nr:DUF364 domain-containing protein [Desulfolutivibrio sulfoxidireducens]QLA14801.1 hypothetical protein GD605_00900 [Desulfolutivibrio sulfoxidireducens]QLA18373.1 hypothetical protein GD604_00840 [Desulfolutivibrio sulfoxidireducens]
MPLLEDLIRSLDADCPVRDIRQGVFHTAVVTRHCGLAATLPRDALRQPHPQVASPGGLHERCARELAAMAFSKSILEAAMGMAAINSLLDVDETAMVERNAAELIMEKGAGKNVAVIGHFPFLPKVREKAANLWVLENNPHEGDFGPERAGELLPQADVVAITGTSITNHTFDEVIGLCSPTAYVIMLGDSVPFSPLLFDHGVDALCGSRVVDEELVLRCVSQGANFRQIKGVARMTWCKD